MVTITRARDRIFDLVDPSEDLHPRASGFVFTEGPVWEPLSRSLLFSDIQNDTRWRWDDRHGASIVARPNRIGNGMFLSRDGSLLVCEHVTSSVVREHADGRNEIVAFHYDGTYLNSPNDVVERSDGTVYFTDPDYGRWDHAVGVARKKELGFQGVYLVEPGGGPARLVVGKHDLDQPNGLCFSPDESTLYVDDRDGIFAYDVATDGRLSNPRLLHAGMGDTSIPGRGNPDGMRCDQYGNIWCAARGGVWVIEPSDILLGIIETPETCANLTWGDDDGHTLFLCTSTTVHSLRTRVRAATMPGAPR